MVDRFSSRYEPSDNGSTLGLEVKRRFLFDALTVDVNELVDVPGDRVFVRCTVTARKGATTATWPAADADSKPLG